MDLKRKLKRLENKLNYHNEERAIVIMGNSEQKIEKQLEKLKETYSEEYLAGRKIIEVLICK